MPVSFAVADHPAKSGPGVSSVGITARELLAEACPTQYQNAGEIRGTSFSKNDGDFPAMIPSVPKSKRSRLSGFFTRKKSVSSDNVHLGTASPGLSMKGTESSATLLSEPQTELAGSPLQEAKAGELRVKNVIPKPNGFVDTIISAYNQHYALVLRPDDVWIAILTQFNFYVNANVEILRANFVAHDGKKQLTLMTACFDDFGRLAREMVGLIEMNIVDPSLRAWALPDFTTTTENDTTVSSILLMATLKAYFEYVYCEVCCGIPRVTLEGERRDWEKILMRLEKLKEYGTETIAWYHLLVPVISRFVKAFDDPNAKSNVDFWQNVAHFQPGGSGPSYYSGWITAFCAFNDKGEWLGPRLKTNTESSIAPDSLTAKGFWAAYGGIASGLTLDGTRFHRIDCDNIPPSYAEVDIKLVSSTGEETQCTMTAGVVGTRVCSSKDVRLSRSGKDDTLRPVVGWWLFNQK